MAYKFKQEKNKSIDNALTNLQARLKPDQQIWTMERYADHWSVCVVREPESVEDPDERWCCVAYGKANSLYDAILIAAVEIEKYNQERQKSSRLRSKTKTTKRNK